MFGGRVQYAMVREKKGWAYKPILSEYKGHCAQDLGS